MWNFKKSINLSLALTYLAMLALAALTVLMPWMVTWYVETMKRSQDLPIFIMVAFYPCVPFCAIALWSMRNILKNVRDNKIFVAENVRSIRVVSICCMIVALITFVGGFYYNPFYLLSAAAAFFFINARIAGHVLEAARKEKEENEDQAIE